MGQSFTSIGGIGAVNAAIDEIELALKSTSLVEYREFIYTGEELTTINIWDSPSKNTKYYQQDFTYDSGNLTNIQITRIGDTFVYNKVFTYNGGGDLISIDIS